MLKFSKNKIIIAVILAAEVLLGIFGWGLIKSKMLYPKGGSNQPGEEIKEVFVIWGKVSSIDTSNNFLMVKPDNGGKDVKVLISETTKMTKLGLPFDPKNPPTEGTFTPKETDITISGFTLDDKVFVKAKENIAGKTEVGEVDFIQIQP